MNQSAVDGANHRIHATNRLAANDSKCGTEPRRLPLEGDHQTALVGLLLDRPGEAHGLSRVGPSI